MEFRVISLPPFRAAVSGLDKSFDFSENGVLGRFERYFSAITPAPRDSFMPRNFLYYDEERAGMEWMWALSEGMDDGGFDTVEFEGGLYLTYAYIDGDEKEASRLHNEAMKYIAESKALEPDTRLGHYAMGHIITPASLIKAQGFSQMETFIPVKLSKI